MKLEMINNEVCPDCLAVAKVDRKEPHRHSNGQPFESREFACGCILDWSPNFNMLRTIKPCPNTQEQQEYKAKRRAVKEKIEALLAKADVDDYFKKEILDTFVLRYID